MLAKTITEARAKSLDMFDSWYEDVLQKMQEYFSGSVADHADRAFMRAWAEEYYRVLGPERGKLQALAGLTLIMADYDYDAASVDYAKLSDPEDRIRVLVPAGFEHEFDTLFKLTCLKMHEHNLAKFVSYPQYNIEVRIEGLRAALDMESMSSYEQKWGRDPAWWQS